MMLLSPVLIDEGYLGFIVGGFWSPVIARLVLGVLPPSLLPSSPHGGFAGAGIV